MKKEWPNAETGTCTCCGKSVEAGRGVWRTNESYPEPALSHVDKSECLTGWVYVLPECGPTRDFIKIGHAANLEGRVSVLWNTIWRLRCSQPRTFWAAPVYDYVAAERLALKALQQYRAYIIDPASPAYANYTILRPMPSGEISAREWRAWRYEHQVEIAHIRRTFPPQKRTPGWTELFRCTSEVAISAVTKATGGTIQTFIFDPLSAPQCVERCVT